MFGDATGAWQIRGKQIGDEIGASFRVSEPADVAVLVKRSGSSQLKAVRQKGIPIVWDVIDAWPQRSVRSPNREGGIWSRDQCMAWLSESLQILKPHAVVVNTKTMADDVAEFGLPALVLHHHYRPSPEVNPIREKIASVGYEGSLDHLGKWREVIDAECRRRGWRFDPFTTNLAEVDVAIALREQSGYAPKNWKCNVKLANMHATGTPAIINREQGYKETACGFEKWADNSEEVSNALDQLEDVAVRREIQKEFLRSVIPLASVGVMYRQWLENLVRVLRA